MVIIVCAELIADIFVQGTDAPYEFILVSSTGADEAFINHDTDTSLKIYTAHLYTQHTYKHGALIYTARQFYNVQFTLVAMWHFMTIDVLLYICKPDHICG